MKKIEWKLISELMKNSKNSDRELAKRIGVSQPTITRARSRLEKEGYIKEYTMIPDFGKLGFELMSINLAKMRKEPTEEEYIKIKKEWKRSFEETSVCHCDGYEWKGVWV